MTPELTVVVPAYDEEAGLADFVREILEAIAALGIAGEVLVVDDGSRDRTAEIVSSLAAENAAVRLVRHERNRGMGAALGTGFDHAAGRLVTWLPADGQIPASEIRVLFEAAQQADLVTTAYPHRPDSRIRLVLSDGLSLLIWMILGVRAFRGGNYLFRRDLWVAHHATTSTLLVGVEFRHRLRRVRVRERRVPIRCEPRRHGASRVANARTIWRTFAELLRIRWASWRSCTRCLACPCASS
jgi:glycosyltransferase involved in cell wall biosynthesis